MRLIKKPDELIVKTLVQKLFRRPALHLQQGQDELEARLEMADLVGRLRLRQGRLKVEAFEGRLDKKVGEF